MTEARTFLIEALRGVIAGGDITGEQLDALKAPETLRGAELKAYYGLCYWADDGDIREKDPAYAPMRREGLARLLRRLEAE
ncbi:MAG TPA: hypothetical protein VGD66_05625 [Allosphingosinicella sp.]|jgi:hypothetical protein